jgi:hypothetical protein
LTEKDDFWETWVEKNSGLKLKSWERYKTEIPGVQGRSFVHISATHCSHGKAACKLNNSFCYLSKKKQFNFGKSNTTIF